MTSKVSGTTIKKQVDLEEQSAPSGVNQEKTASDLEQLRDILYGNQARSTEERLNRQERQLDLTRQELTNSISEQIATLADSSREQLSNLRKETVDAADKQNKQQTELLQRTQTELNTAIDRQASELERTNKELTQAIEQLSVDFDQRLKQTQKEVMERIEKLGIEFRDRLHTNMEESRQRDDEIRMEFMALGAWLDDKKASRHDLGQMLMEVGQLLQREKESSLDDPKNQ